MIVVADASPLNYLIQIQCEECLPGLYQRVLVPTGVIDELRHSKAPVRVAEWLKRLPAWLDVRSVATIAASLSRLGLGEREAIQLAEQEHADLLLIDEKRGRREAERRGIVTTGTLGVLSSAAASGLLDGEAAFQRLLNETNFRSTPALQRDFLVSIRRIPKKRS